MGRAAALIGGVLLVLRMVEAFGEPHIGSISRHYKGDMFVARGSGCDANSCVGTSSGTAVAVEDSFCTCQCLPHLTAFRDDLQICIDDIHECSLAPFVSGSTSQLIPFVFLPLKGQIVYPSAEIAFGGVEAPICVVSRAQFLTRGGWVDVRNNSFLEPPFRLFRDEGRTFLQWLGDQDLRVSMEGRLILVHLRCKDTASTDSSLPHHMFTPCVAFRVAGTPGVREVSFAADADAHAADEASQGLTVSEYVAIGVCSVLLGLIYVASVFLYLHVRRRRSAADKKERSYRGSPNLHLAVGEDGVVKSNPLLQAKRQRHLAASENPCYHSDTNSCDSGSDRADMAAIEDDRDMQNVQVTSAMVHSCLTPPPEELYYGSGFPCSDGNSFERLPEQNVSIVETLDGRDDRSESVRAISNGTFRRKLYFNPEYFELEQLMNPPAGAIEFLTKIREVIMIARHKMMAKRFAPILPGIPEEEGSGLQVGGESAQGQYCGASSRRSSLTVSLKRENSRKRGCSGCPGCTVMPELLKPCCTAGGSESKKTTIQKWLDNIPVTKNEAHDKGAHDLNTNDIFGPHFTGPPREQPSRSSCVSSPVRTTSRSSTSPTASPAKSPTQGTTSPTSPTRLKRPDSRGNLRDVKNDLMDAVIKELEVVGQRSGDGPPSLPPINKPSQAEKTKRVFYETDSLEKSGEMKGEGNGFQTPSDYGDVSSQPSPCLSTSLPMEEEMMMRNDVFNKKTGNKTISKLNMSKAFGFNPSTDEHDYEIMLLNPDVNSDEKRMKLYSLPELFSNSNTNKGYSLVSEVYVNDEYNFSSSPSSPGNTSTTSGGSAGTKIRYVDEKKPGHLTIELEDSPDNYTGHNNDSDEFEPDTLDRKPIKPLTNGNTPSINPHQRYSENFIDSLERNSQILLRTSGSFRSDSVGRCSSSQFGLVTTESSPPLSRAFSSLREIYEARNKRTLRRECDNTSLVGSTRSIYSDTTDCNYTLSRQRAARELSPESRHARRQRRPTPPGSVTSSSALAPPDLIPPRPPKTQSLIYEHPPPPKPLHPPSDNDNKPPLPPKNGLGRSTSHKSTLNFPTVRPLPPIPQDNICTSLPTIVSSTPKRSKVPMIAMSSASANSLTSSDYEPLCTTTCSKDNQNCDTRSKELKPPDLLRRCEPSNHGSLKASEKRPSAVESNGSGGGQGCPSKPRRRQSWRHLAEQRALGVQPRPEDSGYLSTDSDDAPAPACRKSLPPESVSETDESLCDGASESGAESVDTNSFFFGSCRKATPFTGSVDSGVGSDVMRTFSHSVLIEDAGENTSDSENVSFVTVLSPALSRKSSSSITSGNTAIQLYS